MPAPSAATYSAAALIAVNTELLSLIDAHANPAMVRIRSAADVLLVEIPLEDPAGTVNGTTGVLTLATATATADVTTAGTAAYAEICSGAGTVILSLPCAAGTTAQAGRLVINTLALIAGLPIAMASIVIG